jgi:Prokaryotic Cytochrome C oxidase subunit IV
MRTVFRHKATIVWLILAAATALSWWLGTDHGTHADLNHFQTTVSLMVLAFIKVRLIMQYFMEVRTAPWPLRLICDVYAVGACTTVLTLYAFGTHFPL